MMSEQRDRRECETDVVHHMSPLCGVHVAAFLYGVVCRVMKMMGVAIHAVDFDVVGDVRLRTHDVRIDGA